MKSTFVILGWKEDHYTLSCLWFDSFALDRPAALQLKIAVLHSQALLLSLTPSRVSHHWCTEAIYFVIGKFR